MIWSIRLTDGTSNCESVFDLTKRCPQLSALWQSAARAPVIRAMTHIERQCSCRLAERRWLLSCRWRILWSVLSKQMTSSVWHTATGRLRVVTVYEQWTLGRQCLQSIDDKLARGDCAHWSDCPRQLKKMKLFGILRLMANVGRLGSLRKQSH